MPEPEDISYMLRCLQLAELGFGLVAPNPMVGCVIVCKGKIIGEGYHQKFGTEHAEVNAIKKAPAALLSEATLYVNLEPCAHYGKTPPCADLIIASKIKRVMVGSVDPYPEVSGKGIEKLIAHGIEVKVGIAEAESKALNRRFFTSILHHRPYIILKYAQTQDGYIGIKEGASVSKQISNTLSQKQTHLWRSQEAAILVGTNTAILDNPQLNARYFHAAQPTRIALDRYLQIPYNSKLLDDSQPTLIFTNERHAIDKINTKYFTLDFDAPDFLQQFLMKLNQLKIQSIIVEGGTKTLNKFYKNNLWDEARIITSKIEWGEGIKAPILSNEAVLKHEEYIADDKLTIYKNKTSL